VPPHPLRERAPARFYILGKSRQSFILDPADLMNQIVVGAAGALITPALFSQPPPLPPGEEGEGSLKKFFQSPLSPGGRGSAAPPTLAL